MTNELIFRRIRMSAESSVLAGKPAIVPEQCRDYPEEWLDQYKRAAFDLACASDRVQL